MLGGPQSPKQLLDSVLEATRRHDIAGLRELKGEFLSVPTNVAKCTDASGNTLTHLAIGRDTATLRYVVEELHADVNAANALGKTPLHEAAKHNFVASCEFLLAHGAREVPTHTLSTPFHTAAACGSVQCLELLLHHAAALGQRDKVNEADRAKQTALHKSCSEGDVRVVEWLLSKGASVDAADVDGCTPLLCAVKMGRVAIVRLLLKHRADVHVRDTNGSTAVHLCAMRCLPEICKMLLDAGAQVSIFDEEGNAPLHLAAIHARPENKDWAELLALLVERSDEALLATPNGAAKMPKDYVSRALAPLFSKEDVQRRRRERERHEAEQQSRAAAQNATLQQLVAERRAAAAAAERAQKEEAERVHRELEDRLRAEDDARARMEEEAEQRRLDEEAARKGKKGGGKSKGK